MKLYILRHAIAVERGTPGYEDDSKRPLTAEGKKKMQQNAQGMKALGLSFDVVFSSPYVRARQTAEIATEAFKIPSKDIILTQNLVPDVPFKNLIQEIKTKTKTSDNVLLVGHEPHLSELISFLLIGKRGITIDFKKGGLCHLNIERGQSTLEWLLTPSQLRQIKKNHPPI